MRTISCFRRWDEVLTTVSPLVRESVLYSVVQRQRSLFSAVVIVGQEVIHAGDMHSGCEWAAGKLVRTRDNDNYDCRCHVTTWPHEFWWKKKKLSNCLTNCFMIFLRAQFRKFRLLTPLGFTWYVWKVIDLSHYVNITCFTPTWSYETSLKFSKWWKVWASVVQQSRSNCICW